MKKFLYLSSTLVASSILVMGSSVSIAASKVKPMEIGVSGSYKAQIGYAKQSAGFIKTNDGTATTSYNTIDVKTESAVEISGSTKTNGGLSIDLTIELKTDQSANADEHVGESFMSIGGVFGGDSSEWIVKPAAVAVSSEAGGNIGGNDKMKIRWTSPSFSGFTAGASYVPDLTSADGNMPSNGGNAGTDASQIDVALKYSGKMGSNAVSGSAGWWSVDQATTAANATTATEGYSLGASTTMGAITVGAGYKEVSTTGKALATPASLSGTANSKDEEVANVGVSWAQGKTTVALNYFNSEMEMATGTDGEDSLTKWTLGLKYGMGPGIDFLGTVQNVVWSDEGDLPANNNKGTAFVGGIAVKF